MTAAGSPYTVLYYLQGVPTIIKVLFVLFFQTC